ncbi:MAG: hypothetical protein NVS2B12_33750 [Ktedonobacteraceae bacterium]
MATNLDNPQVQAIRQSVASSYNELLQLIDGQLAALDGSKLYEVPQPGEWTLMESLAHIREIMPYWANEITKLVAHPDQKFGRTKEDEARIRAIDEHKNDSLAAARAALPDSYMYLDKVLTTLKDSDLALKGRHSKFGEQNLDWFIKEFVTDHLTNHNQQIRVSLQALATQAGK